VNPRGETKNTHTVRGLQELESTGTAIY